MKAAIFLERDGILTVERVENGHQVSPSSLHQLELNRAAVEPLRRLKQAGFLLIGTTNQPGLSSGSLTRSELERMHALLCDFFALDDIVVCPHTAADFCPCRKPKPGLLTEAGFKWHLQLDHCFVISDKWQDAEAALNAGCTSVLIHSPWVGHGHHDVVVPDLAAAAKAVLQFHPAHI